MQLNIPARVIYESPDRLEDIRPVESEIAQSTKLVIADKVKAQVECIREVYRLVRSELIRNDFNPASTFVDLKDLEQRQSTASHLVHRFSDEFQGVVEFAIYIEEYVNSLPANLLKPWVTVPKQNVLNLISNAFQDGLDRYGVYTLLGTYLWGEFSSAEELDGHPGRMIRTFTADRMYKTFGVGARKVRHIWDDHGIIASATRSRSGGKYTVLSKIFVPDGTTLKKYAESHVSPLAEHLRKDTKLSYKVPPHLSSKLNGYFFHYPIDAEGIFNQQVPFIFDNGDILTIPLVVGISPVLIAALWPLETLAGILDHLPVNSRNQTIGTIYKHASEAILQVEQTLIRFNRELHRINLTHLDNRDTFKRILSGMTTQGVVIDKATLKGIDLKQHYSRKRELKAAYSERDKVLSHISHTGGRLHAKYHLNTRTERTSTRHFNIQGMRTVFHSVVIPDPGHVFAYFDVVANDLSMLFNMSSDIEGIKHLKTGHDPYVEIAKEAFGDQNHRKRVKKFVSPYLYGASDDTIRSNAKGMLQNRDITLLKSALSKTYPIASDWLKRMKAQGVSGRILAELNPIDNVDIPIPKPIGGTVGPAMLIQRYGAILFRAIICSLAPWDFRPVAFIHDSVLIQVKDDKHLKRSIIDIITLIDSTRRSRGLRAMNIMMGTGNTWEAAEASAKLVSLCD
ncbi:MAG: hypothetical protein HOI12_13930 [Candidatus Marinimicrobia bacterium]|jgi:hypothetical protein|nr:hypothetical protein [Candidatus Neomarinimicrobiota bacterium]MBT5787349.1 hypothetical protein [Candidatus Neomarinimicrobiota bacterium]